MSEQKTIRKWFWVWEFEKEEQWLNEMALNGWVLCQVGWCKYVLKNVSPASTRYAWKCTRRTKDILIL